MDIKNRKNGHEWKQLDSRMAALLLDTFPEIFEQIPDPYACPKPGAKTQPKPTAYFVGRSSNGCDLAIITKLPSGEIHEYKGLPQHAPLNIPAEVRAEYAMLYGPTGGLPAAQTGEMARQQRALEAQRWQQREANRLAALEEHIRRGGTEDDFSYTMSDPAVGQ